MQSEPISIDDLVEGMTDGRRLVAYERAAVKMDGEFLPWSDRFLDAFAEELKLMAVDIIVADLVDDGYLVTAGVNEDGSIGYALTERGAARLDEVL